MHSIHSRALNQPMQSRMKAAQERGSCSHLLKKRQWQPSRENAERCGMQKKSKTLLKPPSNFLTATSSTWKHSTAIALFLLVPTNLNSTLLYVPTNLNGYPAYR